MLYFSLLWQVNILLIFLIICIVHTQKVPNPAFNSCTDFRVWCCRFEPWDVYEGSATAVWNQELGGDTDAVQFILVLQKEVIAELEGSKTSKAGDGRNLGNVFLGHFMKPYFKDKVTGIVSKYKQLPECLQWWMYIVMCLNCSHFKCVTECHSSAWNLFPLTCHSPFFGNVCSGLWVLRSGIAATRGLNVLGFNLTLIVLISMTQFHTAVWSIHWNLIENKILVLFFFSYFLE